MFLIFIKVDDLEIPELDTASDEVDMEAFWRQVDHSMVARGLIRGNLREFTPYSSDPSSQLETIWDHWHFFPVHSKVVNKISFICSGYY